MVIIPRGYNPGGLINYLASCGKLNESNCWAPFQTFNPADDKWALFQPTEQQFGSVSGGNDQTFLQPRKPLVGTCPAQATIIGHCASPEDHEWALFQPRQPLLGTVPAQKTMSGHCSRPRHNEWLNNAKEASATRFHNFSNSNSVGLSPKKSISTKGCFYSMSTDPLPNEEKFLLQALCTEAQNTCSGHLRGHHSPVPEDCLSPLQPLPPLPVSSATLVRKTLSTETTRCMSCNWAASLRIRSANSNWEAGS